jgi:hypothetical protein
VTGGGFSSQENGKQVACHGFHGFIELANEQDIAYGQSWKLVRLLASLAVVLL